MKLRNLFSSDSALPFLDPDTGASGGDTKANDKQEEKPKDESKPKKLELTEAELEARIADRLKTERDALAAEQHKANKDAEAAEAKKKGEWEAVAKKAETERDEARLQLKAKDVDLQIREQLAAAGYPVTGSKYIAPLVPFDLATKDETIATRVKSAVADYIKDNPRTKGSGASSGRETHRTEDTDDRRNDRESKLVEGVDYTIPRI